MKNSESVVSDRDKIEIERSLNSRPCLFPFDTTAYSIRFMADITLVNPDKM